MKSKQKTNLKIPEDLGVKIGSELEVLWTNVKTNCLNEIKQAESELIVSKEMLKIAEEKIKEEQEKLKSQISEKTPSRPQS